MSHTNDWGDATEPMQGHPLFDADATKVQEGAVGSPAAASGPTALVLAEFDSPEAVLHAAEKVRDAGYQRWDVHTPYPVHGMDDAMGLKPTKIGVISFIAGLTGCLTAVLMMQWMNGYDYPIVVGGKPPDAVPSMVPIMFEMSILFTGFATIFGLLHLARLPRHHHPVFASERFVAMSDDRFFISVEAADPRFDEAQTAQFLHSLAPVSLEHVRGEA
ncbi:MAG: DUF3341 domain-containing protein [Polyangiales bacterium]